MTLNLSTGGAKRVAPILPLYWRLHLAAQEVKVDDQDVIQAVHAPQPMVKLVSLNLHLPPANMGSRRVRCPSRLCSM